MTAPARILIVANSTASTPMLIDEVSSRAQSGARFKLVPTEAPPQSSGPAARRCER